MINKRKSLPEIFAEVNAASAVPAKLDILKKNYNRSTAACLSILFNPNIVFALPDGVPEGYEFSNTSSLSLERALNSFPAFVNQKDLTDARKVKLQASWLRLMNAMIANEAKFAYDLKDRKVETGLTQADVHAAFPNLIPAPAVKPEDVVEKPTAKETPKAEPVGDVKSDESEKITKKATPAAKKPTAKKVEKPATEPTEESK